MSNEESPGASDRPCRESVTATAFSGSYSVSAVASFGKHFYDISQALPETGLWVIISRLLKNAVFRQPARGPWMGRHFERLQAVRNVSHEGVAPREWRC